MGKRSSFERVERDFYPTPYEAVVPLQKHIPIHSTYAEPCSGTGDLIWHLFKMKFHCSWASDIENRLSGDYEGVYLLNALTLSEKHLFDTDYIITNPPWDRKILHPMIHHFRNLRPTWLLFDAGWAFTKQSSEYMKFCSDIVAVGRVKWIPDSKMTGKDDCCWYQFQKKECETIFHGR